MALCTGNAGVTAVTQFHRAANPVVRKVFFWLTPSLVLVQPPPPASRRKKSSFELNINLS